MSTAKHQQNPLSAPDLSRMEIAAEVTASAHQSGAWHVEAVPAGAGGEPLLAVFVGPQAKERATEYAYAKFAAVLA